MKVLNNVTIKGNTITIIENDAEIFIDLEVFEPKGRITLEFILQNKLDEIVKHKILNNIEKEEATKDMNFEEEALEIEEFVEPAEVEDVVLEIKKGKNK